MRRVFAWLTAGICFESVMEEGLRRSTRLEGGGVEVAQPIPWFRPLLARTMRLTLPWLWRTPLERTVG